MKNTLFSTFILLLHFSLFGQEKEVIIKCNLNIEIMSTSLLVDDNILCMYGNACKITQSLQISNFQKDTLFLQLDHPSKFAFLNSLYFQQIIIKEENEQKIIPYIFESNILKFPITKKNCIIEIAYYYQPDYFYLGNNNMPCIFCPYQSSWFSWYFTTPNMKINNVMANIPDHLYFFSNLNQKTSNKGNIYLSSDSITDEGISFFWMEKRYYEQIITDIHENQYNLHLFKGITLTGDSSSCYAGMLPSERVNEIQVKTYLSKLKPAVQNIEQMFNKKVNVDIVDACLDLSKDEDAIRWGSAFLLSGNHVLIVMDTSFWNGHFYIHEIVHAYNDNLPPKKDSSYYFFHESMTEFLSVYFRYEKNDRDSIYESKILKYINLKENELTNIFDVKKNSVTMDFGDTYGVIYLKTPFVINSFAKKIGEDRFIEILAVFYKQILETRIVNFQELEKVFKLNGISDKEWDWFVGNL